MLKHNFNKSFKLAKGKLLRASSKCSVTVGTNNGLSSTSRVNTVITACVRNQASFKSPGSRARTTSHKACTTRHVNGRSFHCSNTTASCTNAGVSIWRLTIIEKFCLCPSVVDRGFQRSISTLGTCAVKRCHHHRGQDTDDSDHN